jgi:hypothetical protein
VEPVPTGRHLFGAEFDASAGTKKLSEYAVRYYLDTLASAPEALHSSFGFYRAADTSTTQNQQRKTRRLTLPVLAIGGAESFGDGVGNAMSSPRTTCSPSSSPTAATGSPRRLPTRCWRRSPRSWTRTGTGRPQAGPRQEVPDTSRQGTGTPHQPIRSPRA